jgi:hypothetical protein
MFIKFGDKTKKLLVKKSKKSDEKREDGVVYMDLDSDDRRVKILKDQISNESETENAEDKKEQK